MNDAPPPLRGTPLLLARGAALTVSIGIVALLMVRAGAGCRSVETRAVAEPRSAAPVSSPGPLIVPGAAPSGAPSAVGPKRKYFPGSKSMGGSALDPDEDAR